MLVTPRTKGLVFIRLYPRHLITTNECIHHYGCNNNFPDLVGCWKVFNVIEPFLRHNKITYSELDVAAAIFTTSCMICDGSFSASKILSCLSSLNFMRSSACSD